MTFKNIALASIVIELGVLIIIGCNILFRGNF